MKPCRTPGCERPVYCRDFCRPCYSKWFVANAPLCIVNGCTKPATGARGMCHACYSRALKSGQFRDQNRRPPNGSYDVRFINAFLAALTQHDHPHYPQPAWRAALDEADHEFRYALLVDRPTLSPEEVGASSGVREGYSIGVREFGSRTSDDLIDSVDRACDAWLHARGLTASW